VWFGDGRYLLVSDIPNSRILRWDETTGASATSATPATTPTATCDAQAARELRAPDAPHHRTGYDGRITVLADRFKGKRLNSPNDITCSPTDGACGSAIRCSASPDFEGERAEPELAQGVYRIDSVTGELTLQLDDLQGPNGLAFSPGVALRHREPGPAAPLIWAYDVAGAALSNKRLLIDAGGPAPSTAWPWTCRATSGAGSAAMAGAPTRRNWTACVCSAQGRALAHPPARALRQPVLRRRQGQPLFLASTPRSTRCT
jgi:gluconolactonase